MRRWIQVAAVVLVAAVPAVGYGQTPSGEKMKDDKMKMDEKMKDDKMKMDDKMKHDKMKMDDKMKKDGKMMDKDKMEKK
jgi:pentapeptide MXKDX repeat protein